MDSYKEKQLRLMAAAYLRQIPREYRGRVAVRFDLLSVYLLAGGDEFQHFKSAF